MCKANVGKVEQFLVEKIGETKGLSEWCQEINQVLSTNRRLSNKELAYIFNRILKNKFSMEYHSDPVQYAFFPLNS